MQKILGLDIGSYSIKAVILSYDFKSYTVHKFVEEPVLYSEGSDEWAMQAQALKRLFEHNSLEYDVSYAALDSRHTSIRRVEFENVRKRDLLTFLENELEGTTPFDLEDSLLESQIISHSKTHTSILAILAKKESVQKLVYLLAKENLKVRKIDIDSLSYLNLATLCLDQQKSCQIIVDIGHKKTTITFISQNKVLFARVLNIGGWYFTEKIKNEFNLSFSDAENLKCSISQIDETNETDKKYLIVVNLKKSITELCNEVSRTIQSFLNKETFDTIQVFITGGSSKIKGLHKYFQNTLSTSVTKINFEKWAGLESPNLKDSDYDIICQSLAIAARGLPLKKGISSINLRKGHFVLANQYDKLIQQIYLFLCTTAIVLLCLFISYLFRYFSYNNQINTIKSQFYKETSSIFSGQFSSLKKISSSKNMDFNDYSEKTLSFIKQDMNEKKQAVETYAQNGNHSVLKILNQISEAVPKSIYFEVLNFKILKDSVFIEADTDNSDNINKIIANLKTIQALSDVKNNSQESKLGSDSKIIHFKLSATILKGES